MYRPAGPPKTILLSRVQNPPKTSVLESHNVCGGPPLISIFLTFPSAPNTTHRLSRDQNGAPFAPSVPLRGRNSSVSSDRNHKRVPPSPVTVSSRCRPSGDTLGTPGLAKANFSAEVSRSEA